MPKYKVYVEWTVTSIVEVEANSMDDAVNIVQEDSSLIPKQGDYLEGSLDVNYEMSHYLNPSN